MPLENHEEQPRRRQRQHEGIVGEATLSKLLPKGYTLLVIIVVGAFYGTMSYRDIIANAEDVEEIKKTQTDALPRVQRLETNQAVIQQQLGTIQREQKRAYDAGIRDRREIIDAIKELKQ